MRKCKFNYFIGVNLTMSFMEMIGRHLVTVCIGGQLIMKTFDTYCVKFNLERRSKTHTRKKSSDFKTRCQLDIEKLVQNMKRTLIKE